MRDKLIELIKEARDIGDRHCEEMGSCAKCHELGYDIGKCGEIIIADHLIANGVTVQQWIPVSERMPDANGVYLSVDDMGIYSFRVFDPSKRMWKAIWEDEKVTHWMPLPKPPKEGE